MSRQSLHSGSASLGNGIHRQGRRGARQARKSHRCRVAFRRLSIDRLEDRRLLSAGAGSVDSLAAILDTTFGVNNGSAAAKPITPASASAAGAAIKPAAIGGTGNVHYAPTHIVLFPHGASAPAGSTTPPSGAFTPAQINHAYGVDQVRDNGTLQDGSGMTIAIIDAYDNPKFVSRNGNPDVTQDTSFIASDLHQFDIQFGLPEPAGFFTKVSETGGTNYPTGDPGWGTEIALDVEWSHAIAPGAKIVLIEANSPTDADLFNAAAAWARDSSGAEVVSMSFGGGEYSGDTSIDPIFHSPASHGLTWVASTGDSGAPGGYPAFSPNVLAVGGTTLTAPSGAYSSETGWGGSGGGISTVESQPAYQQGLVIHSGGTVINQAGYRAIPDVAFDADPGSGPAIYDSYSQGSAAPWLQIGGTSFSSPATAALIAIADQMRASHSLGSLDGLTGTMPALYSLYHSAATYPTDFHDVTSGNNGYSDAAGYDLVTGIGTPQAQSLLPDLAGLTLRIATTTPAVGSVVSTIPTGYMVTFSNTIDPASLHASALTVNGIAATTVYLSGDDKTSLFTFSTNPVTAQGLQTMAMAANSVTELGHPSIGLASFTGTFRYDTFLQQVTSTSPAAGGIFTLPGPLSYTMNFNEAVLPSSVSTSSIFLSGVPGATVQSYSVLPGNMSVQFTIGGFSSEGPLTVSLPAGGVTDIYGNPCALFSGAYSVDIVTAAFPTPLTAEPPLGSIVYDGSVNGLVNTSTDTDSWTLSLNAGQDLSAYIVPSSGLRPVLTIKGPTGATLAAATASAAGTQAVVQTVSVATAGTYTLVVSSANTTGSYTLQAVLNATVETELHRGIADNTFAAAQSLETAFIAPASSLSSAQRAAVLGQSDPAGGFTISSPSYAFEDIKSTGTAISFSNSDDDSESVPIGFTFSYYGNLYTNLYVSTNGLISFGTADYSYSNTDLSTSPSEAAIAAFWTDLYVAGASDSKVLYQVIGSGSSQHLDIQWNDISFLTDSPVSGGLTFEAQLYADGSIHLNYKSLSTGHNGGTYDLGKEATVGIKNSGTSGAAHTTLVYDNGPTTQVNNSKSVLFAAIQATSDYYKFNLTAGQTASVALYSMSSDTATIQLYNASQSLLAAGTAAANANKVINDFVAPATGTYYVQVTPGTGVNYNLVVTRGLGFGTEPNDTLATAQDIGPASGRAVLGSMGGGTPGMYYAWDAFSGSLFTVTASTGAITMLGASGLSVEISDLAYDPNHRILYGSDTSSLYTFDMTTGAGTLVGVLSTAISFGMAFDPVDNMLYSVDGSGTLLRINPSTRVCTAVSGPGPGTSAGGMTYDSADQRIYCHSNGTPRVYSYDAVTYAGPFIDATPTISPNYGMAYNSSTLVLAPGAVSGGTLYAYDPVSGNCTALYDPALLGAFALDDMAYVANLNGADYYSVPVNAGDSLSLSTTTPSDGPNLFGNTLAPQIDLYDPSGNPVASGTVGADGRNETLSYTASVAGTYSVRLTAQGKTQGEYTLAVQGATGGLPPFTVTSTTPANGSDINYVPTTVSVAFNSAVLVTSLHNSALLIDGVADTSATAPVVTDGKTVVFTLPGTLGQGTHTIALSAGSLSDLEGAPLTAYSGSFVLDTIPPNITASSVVEGQVLTGGSLTYTATFDEAMNTATLTTAAFSLVGTISGYHTPVGCSWLDPEHLQLQYTSLPDDAYTLTLVSALGDFQDVAGNILDGEPHSPFSLPSGNGAIGGNFYVDFSMNIPVSAFPVPLTPLSPRGSLVYQGSASALINYGGDTNTYTLSIDPGQTISVAVTPRGTTLRPTVQLLDPGGAVLATAVASAAGQPAIIQVAPSTTATGTYQIVVGGASSSTGVFTAQVVLNAALEQEGRISGASNNSLATAQNIDAAFTNLTTSLASAQRAAVLGQTDAFAGYTVTSPSFSFEDISTTGTAVSFVYPYYDSEIVPIGFTFPIYGISYTNLYVSTSGLISFGVAEPSYSNTDLSTSPSEAVIAPFWDYLYVGGASDSKAVYQVVGSGANQHLDIQWNDISFLFDSTYSGGLTFEAQLYANGSIRFNYKSLSTGHNSGSYDLGRTAAVGIKDASTASAAHTTLVYHNGPTTQVNNLKSVLFTAGQSTGDYYSFTAGTAETDTFAVTNVAAGNVHVDLLSVSGTVIASGTGGPGGIAEVISNASLAAGTYYLRVGGDANVPYDLVVTHGASFASQSNYTSATAQPLSGVAGVLGATGAINQTLTMDEVAYQPIDGLTVKGVTFGFTPGLYAYYDTYGPGVTAYTTDPSIVGDATGVLAFSLAQPAVNVQFGVALELATADAAGATVTLYGVGGTLIGTYPVPVAPNGYSFSSGLFSYSGATPVASATVSFDSSAAPAFALDNLAYSLPGDDWYTVAVPAAGSTIRLATSTPGGGSGEFVNTVAPKLELYDSAGETLLASGVGAGDGHNETLTYAGAAAGTYCVHLVGADGSQGEYFLADQVTTPVQVGNVTSWTADGAYGPGANIVLKVAFGGPVTVTGTPLLALNSGGTASYTGGDGTSTLWFTCLVAAGENSAHLDYTSTAALTLNGGTIMDGNNNAANLTLPAPSSAGSLGANSSIVIDTVAPTVVDYRVMFGSSSYSLIGSARNDLPWQITGIEVVFSKPIANGDVNSLSGVTTTGFSGLGTDTLTWTISPISNGRFATALAGGGVDALTDAAGNPLTAGSGFSQNFNVLYGDATDDGNVTSGDMLVVYRSRSAAYSIFDDLDGNGAVDMSDVQIARVQNGSSLPAAAPSFLHAGRTAAGNALLFGGVSPQTDTSGVLAGAAVDSITFLAHAGAAVVNGSAVTLSGDIVDTSPALQTVDLPLVLAGGDHVLNATTGNLTIAGPISAGPISASGGVASIVVTGSGKVTLSGTNTYNGGTAILSGTLIATNPEALPDGSDLTVGGDWPVPPAVAAPSTPNNSPGAGISPALQAAETAAPQPVSSTNLVTAAVPEQRKQRAVDEVFARRSAEAPSIAASWSDDRRRGDSPSIEAFDAVLAEQAT